ncbi:hypothetical protein H5410_045755 [Solanum commersonii]|uniref:Uncharacterized protein n=1 Tax=Solanum commersonii TaxID=4109 RepID=A0A9J5XAD8_SOLCO|nr:hypothetical protein H5410_045755 [Solanum commersonii]
MVNGFSPFWVLMGAFMFLRLDPKRSKPINQSQFPSNSMQDSTFTIPNFPEELTTEILKRSLLQFSSRRINMMTMEKKDLWNVCEGDD